MLFNSYEFLFYFLPAVLLVFFAIAKQNREIAALWLAAASVFFYGWWNPKFVTLMLTSIAANYVFVLQICRTRERTGKTATWLLRISVAANLALLGYYKYTNFFSSTISQFTSASWPELHILLPLGISFFTFTQIAFLVDAYRGQVKEYNFIHYILFVTYFPHLIAGPVLHHQQMMPQFQDPNTYRPSPRYLVIGITLLCIGLTKKVLLADSFSQYVEPTFKAAIEGRITPFTDAWHSVLSYTLQLYFDFSGYSDMAVGISLLLGIRLPINFNSPYKSVNIIEFWRRWHITLSNFLRNYLYIPLGGNRRGNLRRHFNLFATMLLGGLWHGANWTFVIWGALHGLFLIVNHGWHAVRARLGFPIEEKSSWWGRLIGTGITFICVVVAWVFFRADSVSAARVVLQSMTGLQSATAMPIANALVLTVSLLIVFLGLNSQKIASYVERKLDRWYSGLFMLLSGALAALCILNISGESEFLYFQF